MVAAPHNSEYNYIFLHILKRLKVQIRVVRLFLQKSKKKKKRIIRKSTFFKINKRDLTWKNYRTKKKKLIKSQLNSNQFKTLYIWSLYIYWLYSALILIVFSSQNTLNQPRIATKTSWTIPVSFFYYVYRWIYMYKLFLSDIRIQF